MTTIKKPLKMDVTVHGAEEALNALKAVAVEVREHIDFTDQQRQSAKEFMDNLADRVREIVSLQTVFIWEKNHQDMLRTSFYNDFNALIDSGVFADVHYGSLKMDKNRFISRMVYNYAPNYAQVFLGDAE